MQYGRPIRDLWELEPGAIFLNHGSFGACPKEVLAEQDRIRRRMEAAPDQFFRNGIMPREGASELRAALAQIGAFVNAEERQLAFVENATAATQAALRSIAFKPGDRILTTDHGYNAVRLMVEARCRETGAAPLVVRLPKAIDADAIVASVEAAVTPEVKLAIVDHITSPTALTLPLDRIIPILRKHGARVFVDGAHGIGQLPLDLKAIDADWYTSNAHKWLYAPKGTAFLYASDAVASITRPNVVSHFDEMGFPRAFDYTGTRDNSGWLAIPAALKFFESLDPAAARAHHTRLLEECSVLLASIGIQPIAPMGFSASMRSFLLPQERAATQLDVTELMRMLWERERIQMTAMLFREQLLVRVSAQAYVDVEDIRRLRDALERHGWPGR